MRSRLLRRTLPCLVPGTARPSGQVLGASPPSLAQQVPYPGKSAFYVHPTNCSSSCPRLTFSPSHSDGSGTMASADSCSLSPTSRLRLPSQTARQQVSPGKNADFPCTFAPFTALALDCIGLRCLLPTRPATQPLMEFAFLNSQVCLRLPPDPASRRRPCPWLTVGAINPRKGLSPSSQRPCWAHK